jgi:hypothetical protein
METWISSRRGLGGDMLYLPYWLEGSHKSLGGWGRRELDSMKEKASKYDPGIGIPWSQS